MSKSWVEILKEEMNKELKPSCYHCKLAKIYNGSFGDYDNPPEPSEAECTCESISDNFFDEIDANTHSTDNFYEVCADKCSHFDPHLVGTCKHCGKPINAPAYNWPWFGSEYYSGEPVPVCSKECKDEYNEKQDAIRTMELLGDEIPY
jgi:hypothetical protein